MNDQPTKRATSTIVGIVCLAILVAFLVWPVFLTVIRGFQEVSSNGETTWTFRYIVNVFVDPVSRGAIVNSLFVAVLVTALSLLIGTPLAAIAARYEFAGKRLISALLLAPLILPPFVGAIGLRHLMGRFGAVNSALVWMGWIDPSSPIDFLGGAKFWGVVVMEAMHLYPIIFLNVAAALSNLDPSLVQTAEVLGAGRAMRFRRVTLPLIRPGLFAGATIVFIWSFTELGTPLMFDFYQTAPVQVFWGVQEVTNNPQPFALVVVLLAIAVSAYGLGKLILGAKSYPMTTRAMTGDSGRTCSAGKQLLLLAPFAVTSLIALMPHAAVVLASFTAPGSWYRSVFPTDFTTVHYVNALSHPLAAGAIRNSLKYSAIALVIDMVLGFAIAYLVVRTRVPGRRLIDSLAMAPLAVPGIVLAFGYVAMSLHFPFPQLARLATEQGWTDLAKLFRVTGQSPDPLLFLVIAYSIRRLPYLVRSVAAGLEQTAGDLEHAALNLGASQAYALRRITIPLVAANLIAGGLLTFSFAMLEVSDSLILAQTEVAYPMTKAIYSLFTRLGDGAYIASAMGVWGMMLMGLTLLAASVLLGRKLGAIFRV